MPGLVKTTSLPFLVGVNVHMYDIQRKLFSTSTTQTQSAVPSDKPSFIWRPERYTHLTKHRSSEDQRGIPWCNSPFTWIKKDKFHEQPLMQNKHLVFSFFALASKFNWTNKIRLYLVKKSKTMKLDKGSSWLNSFLDFVAPSFHNFWVCL